MTSIQDAVAFANLVCSICAGILHRCGPFLKETIIQDLLIHELNKLGILTTRELVFNYRFRDSTGEDITICNNQFLRTDVEIPAYKCILELKSTTAATKDDQIWQLRNYLENRDDREWGIVINFINKFGPRTFPKVQCDLLYKREERHHETHDETNNGPGIRKYYTWSVESKPYPNKDDIIETYQQE